MADAIGTPTAAGGDDGQSSGLTQGLVDKGAPWKKGVPWQIVMTQGGVLAAAGLILFLAPGTGGLAMQILALTLLGSAGVSVWRLVRGTIAGRRQAIMGFRAGVGVTVGLLSIMGTLVAGGTDANKIALGVVLGTGFLLYGAASAVAALIGREKGSRFPIAGLALSVLGAIMGLWLIIQANTGIDALRSTFSTLGLFLAIAGGALCAYAYYLRTNPSLPPEE